MSAGFFEWGIETRNTSFPHASRNHEVSKTYVLQIRQVSNFCILYWEHKAHGLKEKIGPVNNILLRWFLPSIKL